MKVLRSVFAVGRIGAQELYDVVGARAALVLVFLGRRDAERLTHIFQMHANDVVAFALPVVALNDDGDFTFEARDLGLRCIGGVATCCLILECCSVVLAPS